MTFGSLFSGIGGFDLGFERAGMSCAWQCEIEPNAQKVLRRHWPNVPLHNDVTEIGAHNLERVDLICGGFPCQDVSVAGKREGLAGKRSGLWHQFHRILAELRPGFCVIENVPGLLSSNGGRDFAVILRGLADIGYGVAWRILDAQYFGLAQRRKRVFIVGHLGDGRAAEILFESESLSWHLEPRRTAGTRVAASLTRGTSNAGSNPPGRRQEDDVNIVCSSLDTMRGGADDNSAQANHLVAATIKQRGRGATDEVTDNLQVVPAVTSKWAKGSGGPSGDECQNLITAFGWQASPQQSMNPAPVSPALDKSKTIACVIPIQEIGKRQSGTPMNGVGYGKVGDPMYTLQAGAEHGVVMLGRAVSENQRGEVLETDYAHQLTTGGGKPGQGYPAVRTGVGVRRLTPIECARLQGFKDDHCSMLSDSAQYRAYGNAVAVNVAEWIGQRITR